MSANISADGKSFSIDVTPKSEQSLKQRVPACNISLVVDQNGQFKIEEGVSRLGDLSFSVTVTGENYYTDQSDLTVENKVIKKVVESEQLDFNPCIWDFDRDGVVSVSDIDKIFQSGVAESRFDLNGDGIANYEDRLMAYEYVGATCLETSPGGDIPIYDGVYDHIPDMKWGYSVNRLLRGGHSRKPLFRVYMAVNYFTDHDFSSINAAPSRGYRFAQDRGGSSFIKEPLLKKFYTSDSLDVEAGEMLVKDMYWTGSEDNLKSDIQEFYALGKQMQEANGINPDEEFYYHAGTKFILSSVRVSAVYDQSGNNKHAYSRFYFSAGNIVTTLYDGQMIMAMGELITNDAGRLSLSGYGYSKDNPNPFGIVDGAPTLSRGAMSFIAADGDETWDTAYEYAPLSDPNEPVYMYTVKDYTAKKYTAPFEPFYDGPHDAIDNLQLIADHYGFNSFQDIFDGDTGRLKTEFIEQIPESSHLFQYNRAIANASGAARQGLNIAGGIVYSEFTGNNIIINTTGYPYYMPSRPVEDPHPGWSRGVRYEDFVNSDPYGGEASQESGGTFGAMDIYVRLLGTAPPQGSDYNRNIGFNKYVDDKTIVTSVRYHDDNFVSGENPRMDFRLNNKRQIKWGPLYSSLNERPAMLAPRDLSVNGPGNEFYEMVAFRYHDEESYESVMADANAYFGTTPLADASHAPTPES